MNRKLKLCWALLSVGLIGCDVDVDLDSKPDSKGEITIKAFGDNEDGSVNLGGEFTIEVIGTDSDGAEHLTVDIPTLNITFQNYGGPKADQVKVDHSFLVTEIDRTRESIIKVTLEDNDGNIYRKGYRFQINQNQN
ncbi:hypothetical protein SAMN03080594_102252 [Arenibacter palladensis]|uniref:Uncharacterized protein n=1 Tax=Arenibacter palladensis TaxID=237373 RepID=A0A1M4XYU0_9FLAO|nr:hypothetical protein [Arenibacter palladensis]SHE98651.1 hypothetical protein SAMN03080594_102252 [Arenibacter palladensis]